MDFTYQLVKTIPVGNALGEGVLWRPSDQTIWWTDIIGQSLFCLKWDDEKPKIYGLPERLGSFGFVAGREDVLIAAFESGFAYYHPETEYVEWLFRPSELEKGCGRRLNDGRVGPDGAFWAGSMLERDGVDGGKSKTGLYRYCGGSEASLLKPGLRISNGLAWSPDASRIYLSDSPLNAILYASFNKDTGECGPFEVFAEPEIGEPDGAITDAEGNYWSALWGGHCVICYDSHGRELARLEMSIPQPTIPTFGGPKLDHLIVASAFEGLTSEERHAFPNSGHLFIYSTNIQGVEPNYYRENR